MLQIALAVMGVWLAVSYALMGEQAQANRFAVLEGDVAAVNFISYRKSVARYWNTNTSVSGTIADSSLTWDLGFVRDARWTNTASGGVLYVYSTAPVNDSGMISAVYKRSGRNILVGKKRSDGTLESASGSVISTSLPGAIPSGAIVQIGG